MISTLLEIAGRLRDQKSSAARFRSTLSVQGAIAVPQLVGGADVAIAENGDELIITLKANPQRPFKRRLYVGKPFVARYTRGWNDMKIGFDFIQESPGVWVGRVDRNGPTMQ